MSKMTWTLVKRPFRIHIISECRPSHASRCIRVKFSDDDRCIDILTEKNPAANRVILEVSLGITCNKRLEWENRIYISLYCKWLRESVRVHGNNLLAHQHRCPTCGETVETFVHSSTNEWEVFLDNIISTSPQIETREFIR